LQWLGNTFCGKRHNDSYQRTCQESEHVGIPLSMWLKICFAHEHDHCMQAA